MDSACGPSVTTDSVFKSSVPVTLLIQSEAKKNFKNYKKIWCAVRDIVVDQDISLEYQNSGQ